MNQKEGIYSDYPYLEKSNSMKKLIVISIIVILIIALVLILKLAPTNLFNKQSASDSIYQNNLSNYNYCLAIATKDQSYCEKTDNKEKCIVDIGIIDNFKTLVKLDDCSSTTGIYNQMICRVMVSGDKKYCEALK